MKTRIPFPQRIIKLNRQPDSTRQWRHRLDRPQIRARRNQRRHRLGERLDQTQCLRQAILGQRPPIVVRPTHFRWERPRMADKHDLNRHHPIIQLATTRPPWSRSPMPNLAPPHESFMASFLAAMTEFQTEGRGSDDDHSMIGTDLRTHATTWHTPAGFATYLTTLRADADPDHPRPAGRVACTSWWWVDGTEYLGRIAVRHELTDQLRIIGGHIGYDVRPTARRAGHGTAMLRAVLPEARKLGVEPAALLTCDIDNIASRKVITANGGELADERDGVCRYWIPTTTP